MAWALPRIPLVLLRNVSNIYIYLSIYIYCHSPANLSFSLDLRLHAFGRRQNVSSGYTPKRTNCASSFQSVVRQEDPSAGHHANQRVTG